MHQKSSIWQNIARVGLGLFLIFAGTGHLTYARTEFLAQVPKWVPIDPDLVVVLSGIMEIAFGALLVSGWRKSLVGWGVAAFFIAVFPGNIAQFLSHKDAFGLNSDLARGIRLLFQPVLVIWALWASTAWVTWRSSRY